MKKLYALLFLMMFVVVTVTLSFPQKNAGKASDFPVLKGPYLGQKPPGMTPEIFAPGIISTKKNELNSVFSPDGREFFFTRTEGDVDIIYYSEQIDGHWTEPKAASFSGNDSDLDMNFSPDGNRLYFCSNRLSSSSVGGMDIWYCERTEKGWSEAENVGAPVNSPDRDTYPCFTQNGGLYFGSNRDGTRGDNDIYYTQLRNGKYTIPLRLGDSINSDFGEGDAYVAFYESFMIFDSWGRPDGYGKGDLYISYKLEDGYWSKATNMGDRINSEFTEYCPILSHDGKYLFFTSSRTGKGDIYWVDAKIIEELRTQR